MLKTCRKQATYSYYITHLFDMSSEKRGPRGLSSKNTPGVKAERQRTRHGLDAGVILKGPARPFGALAEVQLSSPPQRMPQATRLSFPLGKETGEDRGKTGTKAAAKNALASPQRAQHARTAAGARTRHKARPTAGPRPGRGAKAPGTKPPGGTRRPTQGTPAAAKGSKGGPPPQGHPQRTAAKADGLRRQRAPRSRDSGAHRPSEKAGGHGGPGAAGEPRRSGRATGTGAGGRGERIKAAGTKRRNERPGRWRAYRRCALRVSASTLTRASPACRGQGPRDSGSTCKRGKSNRLRRTGDYGPGYGAADANDGVQPEAASL